MNVLNVAKALKDIKIKQLDDVFQTQIIDVINLQFPLNINISSETTGNELLQLLNNDVPRELRSTIQNSIIFEDSDVIRRFYNDLTRCQQDLIKNVEYDDNIKSTFVTHSAFLLIVITAFLMAVYVLSPTVRGDIPPSRVLPIISYVVKALSQEDKILQKELENEP